MRNNAPPETLENFPARQPVHVPALVAPTIKTKGLNQSSKWDDVRDAHYLLEPGDMSENVCCIRRCATHLTSGNGFQKKKLMQQGASGNSVNQVKITIKSE